MTFVVGHDKLLERPIKDVARMVAFLFTQGDYDRLYRLRQHLVQEQLEAVAAMPVPPEVLGTGKIEQLQARVRGEQWKLDVELNREKDDKVRLATLAARFWDGCAVLNAHRELNTGASEAE